MQKAKIETEKIFCKRCKMPDLILENNQCRECAQEFSKMQFKTEKIAFNYYKTKDNFFSGDVGYKFLSYWPEESVLYFEQFEIEVNLPEFSEIDAQKLLIEQKEKELAKLKQEFNLL